MAYARQLKVKRGRGGKGVAPGTMIAEHCRSLCSIDCFHILDHATTSFQFKINEAIHIQKELPCLNQQ